MVKDMVENSSRKTAHRLIGYARVHHLRADPWRQLEQLRAAGGNRIEPAVPLLRRFCRAVNPDAVMKNEAPKVRSRRRRLPGAPSYSYSVRGGTGSSNLPSSRGESANSRSLPRPKTEFRS